MRIPFYSPPDQVILFVSDGDPGEEENAILDRISAENAKLSNKVIIQTFGFGMRNSKKIIAIK